jgi:hypothetical protein
MKVLVCGGRDYDDAGFLESELEQLFQYGGVSHVIHGDYKGADKLAGAWARSHYGVQEVRCPANWHIYGPSAGPNRNQAMIELKPDLVLAFPGGRGTADMVRRAKAAGVKVKEYGTADSAREGQ